MPSGAYENPPCGPKPKRILNFMLAQFEISKSLIFWVYQAFRG
jgi:hypothetical protein